MTIDAVPAVSVGARICALLGFDPSQTGTVEIIFQPDNVVIARVDHIMTEAETGHFFNVAADGHIIHPPRQRPRSKRSGIASPEAAT